MKSGISKLIFFVAGFAVGSLTVWQVAKKRYEKVIEEEIKSVKKAFGRGKEAEHISEEESKTESKSEIEKKEDAAVNSKDYSTAFVVGTNREVVSMDIPYVIAPYEFGEIEGYGRDTLMLFTDGVLADEYGDVVDDVEELIGDALSHMGEYEDDAVYARNDRKRCDYEILQSEDTYSEFAKSLPNFKGE